MAFRAVHAQWGTVFAYLPDLGCGQSWEAVWKVRPPAPIVCAECHHRMYATTSRTGLRFFAHAPGAPQRAAAGESEAHHLLKLELAHAARDAGAHAELEVRSDDGAWRADVLATDPTGAWAMALEAQFAPITAADIAARTGRMRADGVTSCWFTDRPRPPWLGTVPSVRLAQDDGGQRLVIVEGLVKFAGHWAPAPTSPLTRFLGWVFTGQVIPHRPRTPLYPLEVVWTAPQYIQAEDTHLAEQERQRRLREARAAAARQDREKKQAEIREKNAISWAKAMNKAAAAEQAAHGGHQAAKRREQAARRPELARARALLAHEHGITATVGWSTGDSRYAGGIPLVGEDGLLAAVFDPVPRRIRGDAFALLAGLLLLFPTRGHQIIFKDAMKRTWHKPTDGYRMDFVDGRWCACTVPQLVAKISRFEYPAAPSDQMGPAATLYQAECRACGGRYAQPWRRISSTPTGPDHPLSAR